MSLPLIVLTLVFNTHASAFIPDHVLCQTEDARMLKEAGDHAFNWGEPFARKTAIGQIVGIEAPDVEAGERMWHAMFATGEEHDHAHLQRLTVADAGFVRCLQLIQNRQIRVGIIQSRQGGAVKLIYTESVEARK